MDLTLKAQITRNDDGRFMLTLDGEDQPRAEGAHLEDVIASIDRMFPSNVNRDEVPASRIVEWLTKEAPGGPFAPGDPLFLHVQARLAWIEPSTVTVMVSKALSYVLPVP